MEIKIKIIMTAVDQSVSNCQVLLNQFEWFSEISD